MDYKKAKDIRKESFGTLLAEQEGGAGASLKKAISLKTQANIAGLKQTFDPMNIAKKMTFGSNWAPAMVGKLFGSKQENINFFTGARKKSLDKPLEGSADVANMSTPTDVLGLIYRLMLRMEEDKKLSFEQEQNKKESDQKEEDDFYKELLVAITGRKKPKKKKPEVKKEEPKKKPPKEAPKEKKQVPKEAPKEAPKAKREVPKEPTKPTPKAEKVTKEVKPKAEKVTPKAEKSIPKITGGDKGIMEMIKQHEGVRTRPYKDSLGLWTVGVGHLIGDGKSLPKEWDREFSMQEIDDLFTKDYAHHKEMAMKTPGWDKANETGQAAMIDLAFNMGGSWYKKWPNTAKALEEGNFDKAADGLKDSKWYQQVKSRAVKIVDMIRNGSKTNAGMIPTNQALPETLNQNTGMKISEASTQNKDMKRDLVKDKVTNVQISSNIQSTTKSSQPVMAQGDDSNPYLKKARA